VVRSTKFQIRNHKQIARNDRNSKGQSDRVCKIWDLTFADSASFSCLAIQGLRPRTSFLTNATAFHIFAVDNNESTTGGGELPGYLLAFSISSLHLPLLPLKAVTVLTSFNVPSEPCQVTSRTNVTSSPDGVEPNDSDHLGKDTVWCVHVLRLHTSSLRQLS
jgi:hypothetical protein